MEAYEVIATVVSLILAVLSIRYGFKIKNIKRKIMNSIYFLNNVQEALADGKLTAEEISNIVEKAKKIIE